MGGVFLPLVLALLGGLPGAGITAAMPASGGSSGILEGAEASAPSTWTRTSSFRDLLWSAPLVLDPARGGEVVLDPPFLREGARYDLLVVGPEPGRVRLTNAGRPGAVVQEEDGASWIASGDVPEGGLRLQALSGVHPAAGSRIQVREGRADGIVVVRWIGYVDALGHPATFEIHLEPGGAVRFQYLQVPPSFRLPREATGGLLSSRVAVEGPRGTVDLTAQGFLPHPGAGVLLPGLPPTAKSRGCGQDDNWCDVAETASSDCALGSRTSPTVFTPCATTVATEWNFNEDDWCHSCPYSFYIVVECGTEMHLPFFDMEGVVLTITDVFTGVELELEAINQCARQPFNYCDNCSSTGGSIVREDEPTCNGPLVPCEPFLQTSNRIGWGTPLQDVDGDTVMDDLPCGPANRDGCPLGATGSNPAHQNTVTDVVLQGKPGLCGVFRLDIISGGFVWDLFANCTGTDQPVYDIYSRCEDALADFDPLPELVITDFSYSGICPDIELEVEVTNIGCVDADASPLAIEFERNNQGDIATDLGPIPVSTSVVSSIPVSLVQVPQLATAFIDQDDTLVECSEDAAGGATFCIPQQGAEERTRVLCACDSNARAAVSEDRVVSCGGDPVQVDAGPSSVVPCAGGEPVFRYLRADGSVLRDWSPDPTVEITPSQCPSLVDYTLQAACDDEIEPDCIDTAPFQVECAPGASVEIQLSEDEICQGDTVQLDAGNGFASYSWSTQESTRAVEVSPSSTTSYQVTVTSSKGCVAQDSAQVRVLPDPVPPALGNVLRVRRDAQDLVFDFLLPPGDFGEIQVVGLQPAPCPAAPSPPPVPFLVEAAGVLDQGTGPLRHAGGATGCPRLVFYKIRGTSPCSGVPGPLCDGFPTQALPCP